MTHTMTLQEAETMVRAEIKAGYAIRYSTTYNRTTGCEIHVETDQGWNPEPWWQQYPPDDADFGANDTNPD